MSYIVAAGGVNVDIGARSERKLMAKDSNPGRVHISIGGVGHNIARNLRQLGVEVDLLTALGGDGFAQSIRESCARLGMEVELLTALGGDGCARSVRESCGRLGVGLDHALCVEDAMTSAYVYISDERGDMALAVSDMAVCERLTPDRFAGLVGELNGAALVVADTNLPEASLACLAEHVTAPLFIDPVSASKAEKLRPILPRIHTLKPNAAEAELLSGVPVVDRNSARRAARRLIDLGVKRVFLSLGKEGFLAAAEDETVWEPAPEAEVVNTTGAGDALMAAIAWSWLRGENLSRTAALGAAAAAVTIESDETISPALSAETVLASAK